MATEQLPFKYVPVNTFFLSDEVGPYTFQKITAGTAAVVTEGRPTDGPLIFNVKPDTIVTVSVAPEVVPNIAPETVEPEVVTPLEDE